MIRTLLKSVREYKRASILTPLYVSGEVVLECMIPLIMARLIDEMTGQTLQPVLVYGGILVVLSLLSLLCGVRSGQNAAVASTGFARNLRQDLFFRVQDFDFADIDHFSTSSLVTRMTTDVTNVQNAYQMLIRIAVRTPLMLIFSIVMSMGISVKMSLIFLGILPVLGIFLFSIIGRVTPIFRRVFKKYDALNNSVQENVSGIRVVKAFVRDQYEEARFQAASEDVRQDFTRAERYLALNSPVMMFCIYLAMLLVSYFGARMIISTGATELTTGELSTLISYGVQILASMMMLSMLFVMTSMSTESAQRIVEVLEHKSMLSSPAQGATEVPDGSIHFEDVSFKYRADSDKAALSHIDLDIPSGATVGILGGTGASKTTLIQLIPRLYDATEGRVLVGGRDVREYDLTALRDAVAVVLQKNVLFAGTIKENLRWGDKTATDAQIEEVCKLAQADEFVSQMPDGYNTYIEQGGTNVSGGQKQRLCIARALLKKPKILILDDSTSAVDTRTDALIRRAMRESLPETTKILIAQRVSSIEDADMILVMDGGRIVERGTHAQLMQQGGIYHEVYVSQTRGEDGDVA